MRRTPPEIGGTSYADWLHIFPAIMIPAVNLSAAEFARKDPLVPRERHTSLHTYIHIYISQPARADSIHAYVLSLLHATTTTLPH